MTVTAVEVQETAQQTSTAFNLGEHARPKTPTSLKRKREGDETPAVALEDVHIRPYPGSIYDRPFQIKPLRVVSRSRLPLTFLDPSADSPVLSTSRLFTAYITILETEQEGQNDAKVLIASISDLTGLYAVERVKAGVYALCKLCSWTRIGYLEEGVNITPNHIVPAINNTGSGRWWLQAAVQPISLDHPFKCLRLRMAPRANDNQDVRAMTLSVQSTTSAVIDERTSFLPPGEDVGIGFLPESSKTNDEIFETLIRQYLDAVYVSRTSLAFFAKGPLSRARNAFTSNDSSGTVSELILQLRGMLLSMAQMEKKYKEKLPEAIKSFPVHSISDDELDKPTTTQKRRSKKVPKLSREGYYAIEEDFCRRWWSSAQSGNARARPDETFEELQRRRIGDLRRRETLAQITMILEIFALESLPEFRTADVAAADLRTKESQNQPGVESQLPETLDAAIPKKTKRKQRKPQDLNLLLDLLLDKLSIWQSIEQDIAALDSDKKRDTVIENSEKLQEQDMLVGFCTDVVIPFYKSRVPIQALLVNKKLGGPGAVSPDKGKSRITAQARLKPGDKRVRKPLQKTLSETDGFSRSRPPSLSRSAADMQGIPRMKREVSELSLFDIPLAKPSHRDSSSQLRHLQQRQINMTAISAVTESKLKKQAKIKEDLKQVIGTIARPNRTQAVRELADAADKRSLGSASMRKKTMAPVKKVLQNVRNVQVTATPKHRRGFNALMAQKPEKEPDLEEQHAPSSGDFCVPSSGVRVADADVIGATPAISRTLQAAKAPAFVSATPSRKANCPVEDDHAHAHDHFPPTVAHSSSSTTKPSFGDFVRSQMTRKPPTSTPLRTASVNIPTEFTPVRPFSIVTTPGKSSLASSPPVAIALAENTPVKSSDPVAAGTRPDGQRSIYDALGWNDYDNE